MANKVLTPVARTTLTADICRQMVNHLIRGACGEGEKLRAERDLCQQLGVGRASLREGLKALEIMGMIETRLADGALQRTRPHSALALNVRKVRCGNNSDTSPIYLILKNHSY